MNTLLAGPWGGEIGWALCSWIPYLRYISQRYDHVIVGCDPAMQYLYKDFAKQFYNYRERGLADRWLHRGKVTELPKTLRVKKFMKLHPQIVLPTGQRCTAWKKRKFFKYGEYKEECRYDVVIHARRMKRYGSGCRNWSLTKWGELVDYHKDLKFCSIGKEVKRRKGFQAFHVPGTDDKRNIPMEELCNILASSRLTIGPSSGPMHLAHLCGCPIMVWTAANKQKAIGGGNNGYRYKHLWRAWPDVHVKVLDKTWQPQVRIINQGLTNFFEYTEQGLKIPRRKDR